MISGAKKDTSCQPVGWYRSQVQGDICLAEPGQEIHQQFFREPHHVMLVVIPQLMSPSRTAFFFPKRNSTIHRHNDAVEFVEVRPVRGGDDQHADAIERSFEGHGSGLPKGIHSVETKAKELSPKPNGRASAAERGQTRSSGTHTAQKGAESLQEESASPTGFSSQRRFQDELDQLRRENGKLQADLLEQRERFKRMERDLASTREAWLELVRLGRGARP
jgi:hypothetical protein